jgi:hypothetical protein
MSVYTDTGKENYASYILWPHHKLILAGGEKLHILIMYSRKSQQTHVFIALKTKKCTRKVAIDTFHLTTTTIEQTFCCGLGGIMWLLVSHRYAITE